MLAAKDFHARYRSATFGVIWSVLLPLLQGAVLAVVFTKIIRVGIGGGDDYPVFVIFGTVVWSYFSTSLTAGSTAIVDQGGIAGKVYFPRLILPAVPAAANLPGFAISMGVALVMVPIFGVRFRPEVLLLPAAMAMLVLLVGLLSALCSIAHVYFRDVRYLVLAVLMVMFYGTPVIYPLDRPQGLLRALITANPVSGPLQLSRFAVFGHAAQLGPSLFSSAFILVLLVGATFAAFRRYERVACDRV